MKQLKTNSDYAELFKGLMDLAGVNPHEFELFQKGMRNYPRPGDYQLKNKEFQTEPRWGEEWGIYFTPNKYINIDAMNGWKKDLTAEEVRVWAKMNGKKCPFQQRRRRTAGPGLCLCRPGGTEHCGTVFG